MIVARWGMLIVYLWSMIASVGMIEVIFRYPPDKPPYMGVVVSGEFGGMLNSNWVNDHSDEEWEIRADMVLSSFAITLFCTRLNLKYTYTIPSVNQVQLAKFLEEVKKVETFNFGHVDIKKGVHTPVRTPFMKPWVLPISSIDFRWEY